MRKKTNHFKLLTLFLFLSMSTIFSTQPPTSALQKIPSTNAGDADLVLLAELYQSSSGDMRIAYHNATGKVRFIAAPGHFRQTIPIYQTDASAQVAAMRFLTAFGSLFGLSDAQSELSLMKTREAGLGRSMVRFQQHFLGVPVIGGELIVHTADDSAVILASGEILPDLTLSTSPSISAAQARTTAVQAVAKGLGIDPSALTATEPELWIYDPALLGVPGGQHSSLVWRLEVTPSIGIAPVDMLMLIDAHLGAVSLQFNQIDGIKERETYDAGNADTLPGTLVCDELNPSCSGGDSHETAAHRLAGATYDFYASEHGRDSLDDAGMKLISTVHYKSGYANAFWNGAQMVYGDAFGFPLADDVVAHELTHGVTDFESQLFYFYQSGAINESFSDVWGELVDQAVGDDTGDVRWEIGEDVSGLGALRNMQDPTIFGDPDRMSSPNYYCAQSELYGTDGSGSGDNGGVHTNSGVNNKAAFLMTDGGTFNGKQVNGLGNAKVADLYYEVQTNLLTSAADYADLYDALIQASINLGWSAADQQSVKNALDAVEMSQQPSGCPAPEVAVCESGQPLDLFFDDIESGGGNWVKGSTEGSSYWFVPQTTETLGLPGPYAVSGVGNIWGFSQGAPLGGLSDTYLAMKNDVTLPTGAHMRFDHAFGFESSVPSGSKKYDGGILEYSTNGGGTWQNAGSLFSENGYNGTLESGNPLGAIQAFSADSRGYISSRLDLSSLAGQQVRFRFRIGTDSTVYDFGWFIDDVRIYTCGAANTSPSIAGIPDQLLQVNSSRDNAIDLWAYTDDAQDSSSALTFSITNTPDANAGISLDSNRHIDISPASGWTGSTSVIVRVVDSGGLSASDAFQVTVTGVLEHKTFLPLISKIELSAPTAPNLAAVSNDDADGNYQVTWGPVSGASAYVLQEASEASMSSAVTVYTGSGNQWFASGKADGSYYYRVRAQNQAGTSPWSAVQSTAVQTSTCAVGESGNINDAVVINSGQRICGQVTDNSDPDDVYKIFIPDGQMITIVLSGSGGDADLYLYGPGASDVNTDTAEATSLNPGNDELIQGTVSGGSAYWFIDVYAYSGATAYELTATVSAPLFGQGSALLLPGNTASSVGSKQSKD